jgi:hypothetical protein
MSRKDIIQTCSSSFSLGASRRTARHIDQYIDQVGQLCVRLEN